VGLAGLALLASDAAGVRVEQLTQAPPSERGPVWSSEPACSPDGRSVAFTRAWYADDHQGFRSEIAILSLDDRKIDVMPRPADLPADALPGQPAWAPGGQRLAFAIQHGIVISDRHGKEARVVATDHGEDLAPDWSPDGHRIAFQSNKRGIMDIWTVDPRTADATTLVEHNSVDGFPSWSPDGRYIALSSNRDGNFDIWLVPLGAGYPRRLTHDPHKDVQPDWSPDGRFLVFVSDREGTSDLWIIPARGGEATRLTSDPGEEIHPDWCPDGNSILFTSNRSGGLEVWRLTELPPPELLERDFEGMARRQHRE
jgi:Tol biopolymer transport system component